MVSSNLRLWVIQCLARNSVSSPVDRCVTRTRLRRGTLLLNISCFTALTLSLREC